MCLTRFPGSSRVWIRVGSAYQQGNTFFNTTIPYTLVVHTRSLNLDQSIFAAARLRVAASEKAEAEKILQIKKAEGEAESKYLSGLGVARQRQAIVDGLRDSVLGFSVNVPGTTAKDIMDMVLVTQYFDTMKEIGADSKSSAVFIPHGPGAVRDVATQIRDGLLQGNAAS